MHRVHILFMAYSMHAREPRMGGSRKMELQKERPSEGISFREFTLWKARKDTQTLRRTEHNPISEKRTDHNEEDSGPMALLDAAREWFTKNGLEGFLCIADPPPHEEP